MALAKVVERLLGLGNQTSGLLQHSFAAMMEASVRLREVQEEGEEETDEDEDEDGSDEETDDDDSEDDVHEETEEEVLERCAQAAVALENGTVVEGDEEDQDQEIELGGLEEVDQLSLVPLLIERTHHILLQGMSLLPREIILSFLQTFPECSIYFQQLQL